MIITSSLFKRTRMLRAKNLEHTIPTRINSTHNNAQNIRCARKILQKILCHTVANFTVPNSEKPKVVSIYAALYHKSELALRISYYHEQLFPFHRKKYDKTNCYNVYES